MLPSSLTFIDTETTGLSATRDRIIDIGLIRVEDGRIVDEFTTLIDPEQHVSPFILQMTGINGFDLEKAPNFAKVAKSILTFCQNSVLVAHNARFDYAFLRHEFKKIQMPFSCKHICTVKLSRSLFPKERHHNLDSIIERFAISCKNRHRALDDARVLVDFYSSCQKQCSLERLERAIFTQLKHPSLPTGIKPSLIKHLPQSAGVYIFYGDEDIPLYIGKSINIKDRVLSHFSKDLQNSREMQMSQQVKRIDVVTTVGELGALLKESELIKKMQPIFNRKLRDARRIVVLREIQGKVGYTTVKMEEVTSIQYDQTDNIIATCMSKMQARQYLQNLKEEYGLCEKLLGLEKGSGGCFAYRLGKCKGACVGRENPLAYNARCIIAFSKKKIKKWPFEGPVILYEKNEDNEKDEFLVDKWCLLGKKSTDEYGEGIFQAKDYRFDIDTYKILLQFIKNRSDTMKMGIIPLTSRIVQLV